MRVTHLILALTLTGALWASASSQAVDHAVISPYLADDVDDIAVVDLTKVDLAAAFEEILELDVMPKSDVAQARQTVAAFQQAYAELPRRGGRRAYVVIRPSDFVAGGTTWIVEVAKDGDVAGVVELLKDWVAKVQRDPRFGDLEDILPKEFEVVGNVVLGGPSADRLAAIKSASAQLLAPRLEATQALAALDGADIGVVAFGSADSRRVVRELFPAAPPPFQELDGRFLANGVRWIALTAKLPPAPAVSLTVESFDDQTATTLEQAADKALVLAKALAFSESVSEAPAHRTRGAVLGALLPLVDPKRDGARLTVTLGDDQKAIEAVKHVLLPAVASARGAAQRNQRMNNFKQILLGMHNYESANKTLPPAASRDASGKPLLSWRVLILPYIEEKALYDQFHLDEPWDSEHNIKLISTMPAPYLDPRLPASDLAKGRTTVLVPRGEKTLFRGDKGLTYRDVTDGTSNTIALVSVTPERAVVWTKPDDWEVDLANPLRGVKGADGEGFIAGFVDGSVRFIANSVDSKELAAQLTADGDD